MSLRNYLWPISASVLFHGALIAFVLVGWESSPAKQPSVNPPKYIEAKLVELKPKAKQVAVQQEQPKKVDLTKQRREQELAQKRAEEKRAQQRREAEQKRKAEQKRQAEEKRKAEEKRQRELEQKRQAEQEAQEKLERQRLQEEALREALQEEKGMIMEDQYATDAMSYMGAIRRRIEQSWSPPPSARNGMQAVLAIQLVPTGRVVSVGIVKSSGNAAFDRSAEQAVRQVEVFPEVKDMPPEVFERYYRRFNLLFNPQDLRQ